MNCMVLHHAIMCRFLNHNRPSLMPWLQLSGWVASIKQPVGVERRCTCTQQNLDSTQKIPLSIATIVDMPQHALKQLSLLQRSQCAKSTVGFEMILIGLRDHMLTGFKFQTLVFIIKLGENYVGITELDLQLDMLCPHCKMEIDHGLNFCCA